MLPSLPHPVLSAIGVNTQPLAGLHVSVVHDSLSLQVVAAPGTQLPPAQASPVVHAFPSLQATVLFVCVQPVAGLHPSVVQTFASLQLRDPAPEQVPPAHVSPVVQAFPSLHDRVLFVCTHPLAGLHVSSVHTFPSLQFGAAPPTHDPAAHVSPVVHAFPSLQALVLFV
jgi:hypothetical protein